MDPCPVVTVAAGIGTVTIYRDTAGPGCLNLGLVRYFNPEIRACRSVAVAGEIDVPISGRDRSSIILDGNTVV